MSKKKWCIVWLVFIAFTVDRYTKFLFINKITSGGVVFDNLLVLELHKNSGVAFGLLINNIFYYILVSLILLILINLLINSYKDKNLYILTCLLFILAGASSNLIDRVRWGAVVDYINVPWWSVFNLADCYIVIAVIFWLVNIFKNDRKKISKAN